MKRAFFKSSLLLVLPLLLGLSLTQAALRADIYSMWSQDHPSTFTFWAAQLKATVHWPSFGDHFVAFPILCSYAAVLCLLSLVASCTLLACLGLRFAFVRPLRICLLVHTIFFAVSLYSSRLLTRQYVADHPAHDKPNGPVAQASDDAIRDYPELGVAGSWFNSEFVARYQRYQQERPNYFRDTSWPMTLANETERAINPK